MPLPTAGILPAVASLVLAQVDTPPPKLDPNAKLLYMLALVAILLLGLMLSLLLVYLNRRHARQLIGTSPRRKSKEKPGVDAWAEAGKRMTVNAPDAPRERPEE